MIATEFRDRIIIPTLHLMGRRFAGSAAVNLLLGTALQESGLRHLRQVGGPARGVYQMEPATHDDLWSTYLMEHIALRDEASHHAALVRRRKNLARLVSGFLGPVPGRLDALEGNLYYATAMARLHYWRVPAPLPQHDDIGGFAAYWKEHWNTRLGRGTEAQFIRNWKEHMTS